MPPSCVTISRWFPPKPRRSGTAGRFCCPNLHSLPTFRSRHPSKYDFPSENSIFENRDTPRPRECFSTTERILNWQNWFDSKVCRLAMRQCEMPTRRIGFHTWASAKPPAHPTNYFLFGGIGNCQFFACLGFACLGTKNRLPLRLFARLTVTSRADPRRDTQ